MMTTRRRRWWLVPCSVALLGAAFPATDFSGTWQIDMARSTETAVLLDPTGPPPPPPPPGGPWQALSPETITQSGQALTIQTGSGAALKLTTDGKESLNTAPDGTVHRSTSRWEGGKLVTKWTLEDQGQVRAHGTDTRWLEDGGKVLVNDRTRRSRWMELTFHIVWVRRY